MRCARASVWILQATLLAIAARGQIPSPTGNLYGAAFDPDGKPLQGATVALRGPGAGQLVSTDAKGDFHFLSLSPGAYSVTLERTGFETVHRDVAVALGKNSVVTVLMPVAGAAEAVTISGNTPAVDSRKTETGATYSRTELTTSRRLAILGPSFARFPASSLTASTPEARTPDSSPRSSGRALTRIRTPTTWTAWPSRSRASRRSSSTSTRSTASGSRPEAPTRPCRAPE